MEYEPQTLGGDEMGERLDRFEAEFFDLARVTDVITGNLDTIMGELDKRLDALVMRIDQDNPQTKLP
ncbi:MAG: hypothetical protein RL538_75 [Candidatus Parcubacteria bacterium]|jgi:hypothetical protein